MKLKYIVVSISSNGCAFIQFNNYNDAIVSYKKLSKTSKVTLYEEKLILSDKKKKVIIGSSLN